MTPSRHGPVLITGLDHSGKTPLRVVLDAHPALALARRTYFWTRFDGRFGSLDRPANLARCIDALSRHGPLAALGIDLDGVASRLAPGLATYDRLFALIGEEYARSRGRPRWGIQESLLERHADRLLAAYPNARIIQMVRDPRTWYASVGASGARRGGVGVATAVWKRSSRLALDNAARHPDRYLVMRYEALVGDGTGALRQVCEFIGEALTPGVLEVAGRLDLARDGGELPASARAFIEDEAGGLMAALGYHGTADRRGARELRYRLSTRPVGRAAGMAWRAAEWTTLVVTRLLPGARER